MAPLAGFAARIQLNGANNFSGASWSIQQRAQGVDVSNIEGVPGNPTATGTPAKSSKIASVIDVTVRVTNASFNTSENYWLAPFSLAVGIYVAVRIFPLKGDKSWYFPSALVTGCNYSGQVRGAQPVEFEFEGDGVWNDPLL